MYAGWTYASFADRIDTNFSQDTSGILNTAHAADSPHPTKTADDPDPADAIDRDLLELLANSNSDTATSANPEQVRSVVTPVEVQSPAPAPAPDEPQLAQLPALPRLDADRSDIPPQLVIEHFPHGSPGVPIPGADQGSSIYQSSQDAFGASIWAPFRSRLDWEIARWAKMRGPTSTAVTELLAIPEVRALTNRFLLSC